MVTPDPNRSVGHDAKDLIGTWTLVSVVTERDGKKSDAYGANAKRLTGVRCERTILDNFHCG
jgi:hypothetical protein